MSKGKGSIRLKKFYTFLCDKSKGGDGFTFDDLVNYTGYRDSSVRTYYNKLLKEKYIKENNNCLFASKTISKNFPNENNFFDYMSQKKI